jgi:hypothetical protein
VALRSDKIIVLLYILILIIMCFFTDFSNTSTNWIKILFIIISFLRVFSIISYFDEFPNEHITVFREAFSVAISFILTIVALIDFQIEWTFVFWIICANSTTIIIVSTMIALSVCSLLAFLFE